MHVFDDTINMLYLCNLTLTFYFMELLAYGFCCD